MLPSSPDLQSFPITMVVGNIIDPNCPAAVKSISRDILDRIATPVVVIDHLGNITMANRALQKLTGSYLINSAYENLNLENLDFSENSLNKILDFGIPVTGYQDKLVLKNTSIPIKLNIFPIFNNSEKRFGSVCTIEDISSEVNYTELFQKSELILNAINTGVIAVDKKLKVTMFNRYAEQCFSISCEDILGKPFANLLQEHAEDQETILDALKNQQELRDYEQVFTINGIAGYFLCDTHLLRNEAGDVYGTILVFKNVTNLKEMELQLAKSERLTAIGQLAAGTAHEIKNPLTSIRGFVQLISQKAKELNIPDLDSYTDVILAEIDRINKITTDFLELSKPHKNLVEIININELIDEVMFLVQNEALRKEININISLAESAPYIRGDKHQLTQVFLNIVSNAFQSMIKGGHLAIRSNISQKNLIIDFIDDGTGIPEEIQSKIFNPFFTTRDEGTGLGLAISNRIINDHQGEIRVSSKKGMGTIFSVILPIHSEA